ncbi:hypothetical protein [Citreimonas salinaria]|uniref:Flagellar FliJ protein n=1 Tax=Citreimonas salinaria TaxID=321339 RepID=A0A1H3FEG8_9RHOB|nr:hypothetical protein [Citreimonas salinaria]SDX89320.1 hypothetical protein SAMN05444340_101377 [Citreimonas salinaria]
MTGKLDDLHPVTGALRDRALESHRRNLAESRRIAAEVAEIDALRRAAQSDWAGLGAHRMLGADRLWNGWLLNRRASLLQQAAMARAREHDSQAAARTALARHDALEDLARQQADERRQTRDRAATERLQALGILNAGGEG